MSFWKQLNDKPQIPEHTHKKIYGQTRTLVDILCDMNEALHFSTPEDVSKALLECINTSRNGYNDGDEIAWNCSVRSINAFAQECFDPNGLDIDKLQSMLEKDWYTGANEAYMHYVVEKSIKIIEQLNEFRRYTDPEQLKDDFIAATGGVNHCGPQPIPYYFAFGSTAGNFIELFLERYISHFWSEIAPNGVLDNVRFKDFMYERHARGIEKYGLDAVIRRNFKEDSACHPETFVAYRGGAAPVYVNDPYLDKKGDASKARRFIKSCGEGKGPNAFPDLYEFRLIKELIEGDPKYRTLYSDGEAYLCPIDFTLPIYHSSWGKMEFISETDKIEFIRKLSADDSQNLK